MAVIRPFKGLRPDPRVAHLVASVPYDVVNRAEAAEAAKDNPISFLRVTRSEIELDKKTDVYSEEVYHKANSNMQRLIEDAPLVSDADAFAAFEKTGDVFDPDLAAKYRKYILSSGGTEDAMELYKKFRGSEPGIDPLLKRRGLN